MSKAILVILATVGSGLVAGVFLAFSIFVMAALERLPAPQGVAAMQSINITVLNPIFMFVLFGTGALALYLVYMSFTEAAFDGSKWIMVGSLAYLAAIIVTVVLNVPLND